MKTSLTKDTGYIFLVRKKTNWDLAGFVNVQPVSGSVCNLTYNIARSKAYRPGHKWIGGRETAERAAVSAD